MKYRIINIIKCDLNAKEKMLLDTCVKATQPDIFITPFRYTASTWYADTSQSKFYTKEWRRETVLSLPGVTFIL